MTYNDTYIGSPDNPRTAAIVSYITFISWLISYFGLYRANKTELSAFHLRQSLVLHILSLLIKIAYSFLAATWLMLVIVSIFALILFLLWLMGLLDALNGRQRPIPLVGRLSQNVFSRL